MDVVVHEDVSIDVAVGAVLIDGEGEEVFLEIRRVFEDSLFLISTNDDMIERAGKLDAGLAGHGIKIAERSLNVNIPAFKV
jgi:hypothetical protein